MGHPGFFKTYEETEQWLNDNSIGFYSIDKKTLIVRIYDNNNRPVWVSTKEEYLRVQFKSILEMFNISNSPNLRSLKGCPKYSYHFRISNCPNLQSLLHCPRVHKRFGCFEINMCNIITLETSEDVNLSNYRHLRYGTYETLVSSKINNVNILSSYDMCLIQDPQERILVYSKYLYVQEEPNARLEWMKSNDNEFYSNFISSPVGVECILRLGLDVDIPIDLRTIGTLGLGNNHRI